MINLSRALSIRSRLMLMLLLVSAISAIILIYIGYISGRDAIVQQNFKQLTSIRAAKQYQIENYFKEISHVVEVMGGNTMMRDALVEFEEGFSSLATEKLNLECSNKLYSHYQWFMQRLEQNVAVKSSTDLFIPQTVEACYLQYEYIVDNPHPPGQKHLLVDAEDNSRYSFIHEKYHPYFKDLIEKFGFYDLFLIDLERGDIVYSVYKETDFATNLFTGPYRESNLAKLALLLKTNSDLNSATLVDFEPYRPSYGAPSGFMGITLTEGQRTLGALVVQLPVDEINGIMTGNKKWEQDGLGASGETYLVGEDKLMRSISRFFLEDSVGFTQTLLSKNVEEDEVKKMYRLGTTIGMQRVATEAVDDALEGNSNTRIINDYRGVPVLSSYSPIRAAGLKWAILSEIDEDEVNKPLQDFRRRVLVALCAIILSITFLAMYLAGQFVKPIEKLTAGVRRVMGGDTKTRIDVEGRDEFGELGKSFNAMIGQIDEQKTKIEQQNTENLGLLHNFLPETIVQRIKAGEENIADSYPNLSLIAVDLVGFSELSSKISPEESGRLLNKIVQAFDEVVERNQVEKIRTVGDTYFAVCGMYIPRLDHTKRLVETAKEMQQLIIQINTNYNLELRLNIAIHTGEVRAGIIGESKYSFDVWGEAVSHLFKITELDKVNKILLSDAAKQRVEGLYEDIGQEGAFMGAPLWKIDLM